VKRNNSLTYKGFYGSINFDQEEKIFFGQIEFIKDLVNYEARDGESLVDSFQEAVDDYLSSCKQANKQPDKPFKGSFNVRIGTELHKKVGLYALQHEDTLNNVVKNALSEFINSSSQL
jgi:predicted HicB family RNase H-like nuclease